MARRKSRKQKFGIEYIIVVLFVVSFIIWAFVRLNVFSSVKDFFAGDEELIPIDSVDTQTLRTPTGEIFDIEDLTPLYITIDNMALRDTPSIAIGGKVLSRLPVFEEVYYLDSITPFKDRINIGKVREEEPWVQVITKDGEMGWIFGAGIHFYPRRNINAGD